MEGFAEPTTTGGRDLDAALGEFISVNGVFSADDIGKGDGYAYTGS